MNFQKIETIEQLVNIYLTKKETCEFMKWAFGDNWDDNSLSIDYWNRIHGEIMKINPKNSPIDDIPQMIQIWIDNSCRNENED